MRGVQSHFLDTPSLIQSGRDKIIHSLIQHIRFKIEQEEGGMAISYVFGLKYWWTGGCPWWGTMPLESV